mmetsp:Transcript_4245/g.11780  ORF Transcript_4245/g.11780 Transcript_4245/m.11780 type:complete len:269 (-) Transcript_4245:387-1193(-)
MSGERIRIAFHVSSSNGALPLTTMLGRKRLMGTGSFPPCSKRRFNSSNDASFATSIGKPSFREVWGTLPADVHAAGGKYASGNGRAVRPPGRRATNLTSRKPSSVSNFIPPARSASMPAFTASLKNAAASSPTSATSTASSQSPAVYRRGYRATASGETSTWTTTALSLPLPSPPPASSLVGRRSQLNRTTVRPPFTDTGRDASMRASWGHCLWVTKRCVGADGSAARVEEVSDLGRGRTSMSVRSPRRPRWERAEDWTGTGRRDLTG